MSKAEELAAALKKKLESEAEGKALLDKAIAQWPAEVYRVYDQIETWLAPLTAAGLTIERKSISIHESPSSENRYTYSIDKLSITANLQTLTIKPVARFIMGGTGRIDIKCKKIDCYLIKTRSTPDTEDYEWLIEKIPPNGRPRENTSAFNEDNFLSIVEQELGL